MRTVVTRDIEADIACVLDGLPGIEGVYSLQLGEAARAHPDALAIAIVLSPYSIRQLVRTHYEIVSATGTREVAGRVLYVNPEMPAPSPMQHASRIVLRTDEREAARWRLARRKSNAGTDRFGEEAIELRELERAFRRLVEQAAKDEPPTAAGLGALAGADSPYRPIPATAIAAPLTGPVVLEIVADPFPSRKRVLVADDDPDTEIALAELGECEVVHVRDGWSAIDRLTTEPFDMAVCAVVLGGFSGAKIRRLVVGQRPEIASRFVFLAAKMAVAHAPPSSVRGRVLTRPLDIGELRALLKS